MDVDNPAGQPGQPGQMVRPGDDPIALMLLGLVGAPMYSSDNVELGVIRKVEENEDSSVMLVIDVNDALKLGVNRVRWQAMPDESWANQVSTQMSYNQFASVIKNSRGRS